MYDNPNSEYSSILKNFDTESFNNQNNLNKLTKSIEINSTKNINKLNQPDIESTKE